MTTLVPLSDLKPDLTTRPLVEGFLDQRTLCLVYGPSNCGKTFFVLDLALHVATAMPWIGHPTHPGKVIYLAAEAGRSISNRVAAWMAARCHPNWLPHFAAVLDPINLCDKDSKDLPHLLSQIHHTGDADLIVVDTVARAMSGASENSADSMGRFVANLDLLRSRLGCAVIAVHHTGKDAARGSRGSSALTAAVDTSIELIKANPTTTVAVTRKQRDLPLGEPIVFQLRPITLGTDQNGRPVTSCVIVPIVPAAPAPSANP